MATSSSSSTMAKTTPLPNFINAQITQHWNDPTSKLFRNETPSSPTSPVITSKSESITALRDIIKDVSDTIQPSQRRMWDDTTKRLDFLVDRLNSNAMIPEVNTKALSLIRAISRRDFEKATKLHLVLTTSAFDQEGKWLLGIKRLMDVMRVMNA